MSGPSAWPLAWLLGTSLAFAAPSNNGAIRGHVTDPQGSFVPGAEVSITGPSGAKSTRTDGSGGYALEGLPPGTYTVTVMKRGFEPYGNGGVEVKTADATALDIRLAVATVEETVVVNDVAPPISIDPDNNAGAIVIKGEDLDALPDDPDEMADALQALAGPSAGPNGGQIFIDGFTGGRMPPKASIREIRINANPFSAEYDRLGFGRIEVFTKPGTDQWRAETSYRFNDDSLNTRNPFSQNKPPYQRREWGGSVAGPIVAKKASFVLDFERRYVDDNQLINATILEPADLAIVPLSESVVTPQSRTTVSPRIDWQLSPTQTLVARYTYTSTDQDDAGVGGFSLQSRGYDTTSRQQTIQLTETAVFGKAISETRLRYMTEHQTRVGDDTIPTLQVQDAFTGGGAQVGPSFNDQKHWELQNVTSWTRGKHLMKAGFRLRTVDEDDFARQGYGGTVVFSGGFGPKLDADDNLVVGPDGNPVLVPVTSMERYRRTIVLQGLGLSPTAIRALGGGATQLQIVGGNPDAKVTQWDVAPFFQDDWHATPDLLVSAGLRYETQDNISSHLNLAPRFGFAWSAGPKSSSGQARTVVRGGFGVFYDRVSEDLTLRANRFDGVSTSQYVVTEPRVLDELGFDANGNVTGVPSTDELAAFAIPQATWHLAPDIEAPYTLQSSLGVERQVKNFTLSATFISAQGRRQLRSRNVNAPDGRRDSTHGHRRGRRVPGGIDGPPQPVPGHLRRQQPAEQEVHRLRALLPFVGQERHRWVRHLPRQFLRPLGRVRTRGERRSPSRDPGRQRHRAVGGAVQPVHRLLDGPTLQHHHRARPESRQPLHRSAGFRRRSHRARCRGDALRPPGSQPGLWRSRRPAQPRRGPEIRRRQPAHQQDAELRQGLPQPEGPGGPGGGGRPGGFGGGGFGGGGRGPGGEGGGGGGAKGLTFSLSAQNLFNHVNPSTPVGNLTSLLFGQSLSTAGGFGSGGGAGGNRRIELQARLGF